MNNINLGLLVLGIPFSIWLFGPFVVMCVVFFFTYCVIPFLVIWFVGKTCNMYWDKLKEKPFHKADSDDPTIQL